LGNLVIAAYFGLKNGKSSDRTRKGDGSTLAAEGGTKMVANASVLSRGKGRKR